MDMRPDPFVPPAPLPRTVPPSRLDIIRIILRNPLELWGEPSYTLPWIKTSFFGQHTLIVNDPGLIKHVLVDNAGNYRMSDIRQLVLRPILRDGLLTAEGQVWKRSRKAVAPVFTPRHAKGFAGQMLRQSEDFVRKYTGADAAGQVFDIATDMTDLTFAILAETLFSGEIVSSSGHFATTSTSFSTAWAGSTRWTCCGRLPGCRVSPASAARRCWRNSGRSFATPWICVWRK